MGQAWPAASEKPTPRRWWLPAYTEEADGRIRHHAEWFMLVLALLAVPAIVLEATASHALQLVALGLNVAIWAGFVAELAFVLAVASNRKRTLREHWLDLVIVVVSVPVMPPFMQGGRALRLLRLTQLFRLTALGARAAQAGRRILDPGSFRYLAAVVAIVIAVAGSAIALVDSKDVPSVWNGVWWALVTVTTVGYGDITITTVPGRIIAMLVMLVGISFFAMLTGAITSTWVKSDREREVEPALDDIRERLGRIEEALARLER